ncbi:histone deacetylase family protein [Methylobrevis pamukkalensis]|uniref:Acetylpolyamine aminohydrolase n=1 Tax=Methylobrevis pamukkalensis TaxID=1439726 RepID=A0A1E3H6G4_9HYPH|nr:histone deacetylase family protein [Methylobrevis pamukkalensis]ODN71910.1 Acetylpolyamine aminohydrolase [Methylobrevis pamukkalensis]
MKTVYSPDHAAHAGHWEVARGAMVPCFEKPIRAEYVRARVEEVGLGEIVLPKVWSMETARKVHDPAYLAFLGKAWDMWAAEGNHTSALPMTWPVRGLRNDVPPECIEGLLGFYSMDAGASITAGTWKAVKASMDCALTAAEIVAGGARAAFALCRPPGHHSGPAFMGGYCFINNASVAAQWFRDQGAARVAILDVDYHHGNGTQDIFYERGDVFVANIHGDPKTEYPYFLGHADETGRGAGEGCNVNYPLPFGTAWDTWSLALDAACDRAEAFGAEVIVVSLGVDTFERDPISAFKLKTADYPKMGARIAKLGKPTLFVFEGGYAVDEIGVNAVGVLTGFEGR